MATNENKWNSAVVSYGKHDILISFTIKNFLDYFCQPGEVLETPQMECSQHCGAKWTLQVYAHGKNTRTMNEIEVFSKLVSEPPDAKIVRRACTIYILGKDGLKLNSQEHINGVKQIIKGVYGLEINNSMSRSDIEMRKDLYLPNGHLTIRCEGTAHFNKPNQSIKTSITPSSVLRMMYQEGICHDVILKTGFSEFQCHKAILATASNYFKAKFEEDARKNKGILATTSKYLKAVFKHDTKEDRKNVVDLSGALDEEELRAMLNYIYLGQLELSNLSSVQNLYKMSCLCEMDDLQQACENLINGQTNSGND